MFCFIRHGRFRRKGAYFTAEIAFYLIVFAILSTVVIGAIWPMFVESKMEKAQNDCINIGAAVSQFHYDAGEYPTDLSILASSGSSYTVKSGINKNKKLTGYGPWLREVPKDPWGNAYKITVSSTGFTVYSTYKNGVIKYNGK